MNEDDPSPGLTCSACFLLPSSPTCTVIYWPWESVLQRHRASSIFKHLQALSDWIEGTASQTIMILLNILYNIMIFNNGDVYRYLTTLSMAKNCQVQHVPPRCAKAVQQLDGAQLSWRLVVIGDGRPWRARLNPALQTLRPMRLKHLFSSCFNICYPCSYVLYIFYWYLISVFVNALWMCQAYGGSGNGGAPVVGASSPRGSRRKSRRHICTSWWVTFNRHQFNM